MKLRVIHPAFCGLLALLAGVVDTSAGQDAAAPLIGLARVKRDAGDGEASRRHFEQARTIRPLDASEMAEYFWVAVSVDPAHGLVVGRDVLRVTPSDLRVRDKMLSAAIAVGNEHLVRELADGGRRLEPRSALWPRHVAHTYLRIGQTAKAIAPLQETVSMTDARMQDRIDLALALEATEQSAASLSMWATVPANIRDQRSEWATSRLRMLAQAGGRGLAIGEIRAWLSSHPNDEALRVTLVDLLEADSSPLLALDALAPLLAGPSRRRWTDREAVLASAADAIDRVIKRLTLLGTAGEATIAEHERLAVLLLETHDVQGARLAIVDLSVRTSICAPQVLSLWDRLPDPDGTDGLLRALTSPSCQAPTSWLMRGVERAVARGRLRDALSLFAIRPELRSVPSLDRLEGQLHLWTGDSDRAIERLVPILDERPDDTSVRTTLVHAYRAAGRSVLAWTTAQPLVSMPGLADTDITSLAELAVEADHPGLAIELLADRAPGTDPGLRGRAWLAMGRPVDAALALSTIDVALMTPSEALAWIDSTAATRGRTAAVEKARRFSATSREWIDVLVRRIALERNAGSPEIAETLKKTVISLDPTAASIGEAETALSDGRPGDALIVLQGIPEGSISRADDLRATALAATGSYREASRIVTRLRIDRPAFEPLIARQAELLWLQTRAAADLDRLIELAAGRASGYAATAAAAALLSDARYEEALAVLGDRAGWREWPSRRRVLAARGLYGLDRPIDAFALIDDLADLDLHDSIFRARLLATTGGTDRARAEFRILAESDHATADVFLTWSAVSAPTERVAILEQGAARFPDDGPLAITLAEALANLARHPNDPAIERALVWLDAVPHGQNLEARRDQLRARVLATAMRWPASLTIIDTLLAADPTSLEVLKLKAEVLSWSGRHDEAIEAYETYLARVPGDVAARRQQARVAGWAGKRTLARQLYGALRSDFPDSPVIAAEGDAKRALLDGRWRDAAAAYGRWVTLEPDDTEAQFELSEVLRADGRTREADLRLASLESTSGHQLAADARARAETIRKPTVTVVDENRQSDGYGGQRQLDLNERGGSVGLTFGPAGRSSFGFNGAVLNASGRSDRREGHSAAVAWSQRMSDTLRLGGQIGTLDFGGATAIFDGTVEALWQAADRVKLTAGLERQPVFDSIQTIDAGLVAYGGFGALLIAAPAVSMDARVSVQSLSDGNARRRVTVYASRPLGNWVDGLQAVAWAEALSHRRQVDTYFSPGQFFRLDGGFEYARTWRRPRFRDDRHDQTTIGYLVGTDSRGVLYHHPSARLALEIARGIAIEAKADWIRSSTYRESAFTVSARFFGLGRP